MTAVLLATDSDRIFDEAFSDWIQRELDDPSEGVRRSLRRITARNFGQDVDEDAPIARLDGKLKASQDEALQDRHGTVRALQAQPGGDAGSMAGLVAQAIAADPAGGA